MPPFDPSEMTRPSRARTRASREVLVITPSGWAVMHTDFPTVSILIPVHNQAQYLARCLDCIFAQDYPPELIEVLVIDDGSTDGSREIVSEYRHRHPNLRLLNNPTGRVATALNLGVQVASGDIIVRVDGNTFIAPDYVRRCVVALETEDARAVGGVLRPVGETDTGDIIAAVMAHPLGGGPARFRQAQRRVWADTTHLGAWRRETLLHLGGFNERLAANENHELCYRLRRMGGRILVDPDIRAWTVTCATLGQLWRQSVRDGYWKAQMLKDHPRALRLRHLLAPLLVAGFWTLWLVGWHFPWASRAAMLLVVGYAVATAAVAGELALRLGGKRWWKAWLAFWAMHWGWGMGFWRGVIHPRTRTR